jgi:hypothetical protein
MKNLFLSLIFALSAGAASPTFSSFDTSKFTISNYEISTAAGSVDSTNLNPSVTNEFTTPALATNIAQGVYSNNPAGYLNPAATNKMTPYGSNVVGQIVWGAGLSNSVSYTPGVGIVYTVTATGTNNVNITNLGPTALANAGGLTTNNYLTYVDPMGTSSSNLTVSKTFTLQMGGYLTNLVGTNSINLTNLVASVGTSLSNLVATNGVNATNFVLQTAQTQSNNVATNGINGSNFVVQTATTLSNLIGANVTTTTLSNGVAVRLGGVVLVHATPTGNSTTNETTISDDYTTNIFQKVGDSLTVDAFGEFNENSMITLSGGGPAVTFYVAGTKVFRGVQTGWLTYPLTTAVFPYHFTGTIVRMGANTAAVFCSFSGDNVWASTNLYNEAKGGPPLLQTSVGDVAGNYYYLTVTFTNSMEVKLTAGFLSCSNKTSVSFTNFFERYRFEPAP